MLNIKNTYDDSITEVNNCNNLATETMSFKLLPLEVIFANPDQPRKFFDKEELENLAQSIRQNGVLQPILVRNYGDRFQIVSGERRFRACKIAGLRKIPAVIRKMGSESTALAALIENVQRQDLNPIEEAMTLKGILLNYGLTHDQLATRVGKSRSALTNRLRLLQLPEHTQQLVANGQISAGHAKMLAGLKTPVDVEKWTARIIREKLSVCEVEKQIAKTKQLKASLKVSNKKKKILESDVHIRAVEENLQELLGAKVKIKQGKSKSKIEIEFYDNEDLERVLESVVSICI